MSSQKIYLKKVDDDGCCMDGAGNKCYLMGNKKCCEYDCTDKIYLRVYPSSEFLKRLEAEHAD
jgi:hypothetical protein